MTKIIFQYNNTLCRSVEISGHAGYADKGYDIVCSGITTAAYTSINLIDKIKHDCYKLDVDEKAGFLKIEIDYNKLSSDDVRVVSMILDNLLDMFNEIKRSYKKYLKIEIL